MGTVWGEVAHFAPLYALPAATGEPRGGAARRRGAAWHGNQKEGMNTIEDLTGEQMQRRARDKYSVAGFHRTECIQM